MLRLQRLNRCAIARQVLSLTSPSPAPGPGPGPARRTSREALSRSIGLTEVPVRFTARPTTATGAARRADLPHPRSASSTTRSARRPGAIAPRSVSPSARAEVEAVSATALRRASAGSGACRMMFANSASAVALLLRRWCRCRSARDGSTTVDVERAQPVAPSGLPAAAIASVTAATRPGPPGRRGPRARGARAMAHRPARRPRGRPRAGRPLGQARGGAQAPSR